TRLCERLQRTERDVVRGREGGGRRLRQREERAQLGLAARGVEVALPDVLGAQRQSACGQLLLVAAQAVGSGPRVQEPGDRRDALVTAPGQVCDCEPRAGDVV